MAIASPSVRNDDFRQLLSLLTVGLILSCIPLVHTRFRASVAGIPIAFTLLGGCVQFLKIVILILCAALSSGLMAEEADAPVRVTIHELSQQQVEAIKSHRKGDFMPPNPFEMLRAGKIVNYHLIDLDGTPPEIHLLEKTATDESLVIGGFRTYAKKVIERIYANDENRKKELLSDYNDSQKYVPFFLRFLKFVPTTTKKEIQVVLGLKERQIVMETLDFQKLKKGLEGDGIGITLPIRPQGYLGYTAAPKLSILVKYDAAGGNIYAAGVGECPITKPYTGLTNFFTGNEVCKNNFKKIGVVGHISDPEWEVKEPPMDTEAF
jgi:hypothetical protein